MTTANDKWQQLEQRVTDLEAKVASQRKILVQVLDALKVLIRGSRKRDELADLLVKAFKQQPVDP